MMIEKGPEACFKKDKKGYLPIHVACSRHCSPEKLKMLLTVNPGSLFEKTLDGLTILDLANQGRTASHPNQALIEEIQRRMDHARQNDMVQSSRFQSADSNSIVRSMMISGSDTDNNNSEDTNHRSNDIFRNRLDSNDSARISDYSDEMPSPRRQLQYEARSLELQPNSENEIVTPISNTTTTNKAGRYCSLFRKRKLRSSVANSEQIYQTPAAAISTNNVGRSDSSTFVAAMKVNSSSPDNRTIGSSDDRYNHEMEEAILPATVSSSTPSGALPLPSIESSPAHLLLHFSQNSSSSPCNHPSEVSDYVEV
jgi:hypothetical protein